MVNNTTTTFRQIRSCRALTTVRIKQALVGIIKSSCIACNIKNSTANHIFTILSSHAHAPRHKTLQHAARNHRCSSSKLAPASAAAPPCSRHLVSYHARQQPQSNSKPSFASVREQCRRLQHHLYCSAAASHRVLHAAAQAHACCLCRFALPGILRRWSL